MTLAVEVRGLTKGYRRRARGAWLGQELLRLATRGRSPAPLTWAVRDVSFEVRPGAALGIVGRNGAGKSTLLKLLAGIARPTSGSVRIRGRVATQLGLGLGFNAHLSGRENLLLESTILGLSTADARRRLPGMIDYADIGDAIDQPLWTYSTGMIARLGFAAAVHTDFDVLLLDEALSAGDRAFRRRCDETLDRFRAEGRTLVVVSHGVDALRRLADDALWLADGQVRAHGPAAEVLDAYTEASGGPSERASADGGGSAAASA